jgi:hypothetical protein
MCVVVDVLADSCGQFSKPRCMVSSIILELCIDRADHIFLMLGDDHDGLVNRMNVGLSV